MMKISESYTSNDVRLQPMLLTNNQRKMHGQPLRRKTNSDKRYKTRCEAWETVGAFLDYCKQEG